MVKKGGQPKGGKPGGGGGNKKITPSNPAEGSDFIVFTNSDKDPKPKKPTNAPSQGEGSGAAQPGEPPKPTVKQLIGGASWTGKLPVNMLSEHAQKQRWEKPEYSMVSQKGRIVGLEFTNAHGANRLRHRKAFQACAH